MVKDCIGNEITAGCTIVYPVRKRSEMWLKRMKVTQVSPTKLTGHNALGNIIYIKNLNTVAVVEPPKS